MSELTSLLNSTIQTGETVIEDNLFQYLDQLADGTYKTSNGSLTIVSTEDSVDTVTGSYTDEGTILSATAWFTGQETASQSLIDLVTGTAQTGVYFAYDTDVTTVTVAASYTSSSVKFSNATASLAATDWWGDSAAAQAAATDLQVTGLRFAHSSGVNGVTCWFYNGTDVVEQVFGAGAIANYATTYTPGSSVTTTTVDTLYWDGDSVETMTFDVGDSSLYATGVTEGGTLATWDTNKQSVLGMELLAGDIQLQII
jgi:hypothetical protein